jgi:hypothetical protein
MSSVLDKSLEPFHFGKQSEKVFEEGKVTIGKIKESKQREDPWHPLSPGRSLFPAVCCSLLEIGNTFPKCLSGIMNNPGLVDIKAAFFL